jgi:D-alanyl-lipoteichoic acid acyltransferase DltB (MBOAT superfamily)
MLFNSLDFLIFFILLIGLLLIFKKNWQQKWIYLIASYIFYMWWDPAFIILLIFSTVINFYIGERIYRTPLQAQKKAWLVFSLVVNLGMLGFFKYFNFFEDNLFYFLRLAGYEPSWVSINILLPIGISFYTFQALSYVIDIYRGDLVPTKSIVDFAVYKAFFPQLVAGPIVRAADLVPQFKEERKIVFDRQSMLLVAKGLFKKVVIADNLGSFTDSIFSTPAEYPSVVIWMAAICFTIQIYCDFSGYTDIAIGIARILGFTFPINFNKPYFALTPSDFWRRWHISLSSWLRDYLYIPLGGSRFGNLLTYRNLMITMLLGGLWHGASWNFVIWGGMHGAFQALYKAFNIDRFVFNTKNPLVRFVAWAVMFLFTVATWIVFRLTDFSKMKIALWKFFAFDFNFSISSLGLGSLNFFSSVALIALFTLLHYYSYRKNGIERYLAGVSNARLIVVLFVAAITFYFFIPSTEVPFIYFQF